MLIDVLLGTNILITILSFITNMILCKERKKNIYKSQKIDEHIRNLDYKEKEDNDMFLNLDEKFNSIILYVIFSFTPILNIFLVYLNIHNIFYIWKDDRK